MNFFDMSALPFFDVPTLGLPTFRLPDVRSGHFYRRLTIHIENLTEKSFDFAGEWFACGGWTEDRLRLVEPLHGLSASLDFESKAHLSGVSGYVYYQTPDLSQTLVLAFSCPVATAPCFTARLSSTLPDCQTLLHAAPDCAHPGAGLRLASRTETALVWETVDLSEEHVTVRCVLLPTGAVVGGIVSEELAIRVAKAKLCRSILVTGEDSDAMPPPQGKEKELEASGPASNEAGSMLQHSSPGSGFGLLTTRSIVLEVDNRSKETFQLDGDWFDAGMWAEKPVTRLRPGERSLLTFVGSDFLKGIRGLVWYVNVDDLQHRQTYFSAVFSNPWAGQSSFNVWAGSSPNDLREELYRASQNPLVQGVQLTANNGSAWSVVEEGSRLHVRIVIPEATSESGPRPEADVEASDAFQNGPWDFDSWSVVPYEARGGDVDVDDEATNAADIEEAWQEDAQMAMSCLTTTFFPRPRDAIEGVGSGVKAAGAGCCLGAASLVVVPALGAREDGVAGFVTGVAKGVIAAVALCAAGTTICATQVVRGVYHTPEAIKEAQAWTTPNIEHWKRWDPKLGAWVKDSCDLRHEVGEAAAIEDDEDDGDPSNNRERASSNTRDKKVAETDYYDLLGVQPDATQGQIKLAFRKAAQKMHPDKNIEDVREATVRFQELQQAYEVLSNVERREKYDTLGKDALNADASLASIDVALFFSTLFGNLKFDRYVGKLYVAIKFDLFAKELQRNVEKHHREAQRRNGEMHSPLDDAMPDFSKAVEDRRMTRQQFKREVTCAASLCERLERFVSLRDEAGFVIDVTKEAKALVTVPFGGKLLRLIGGVYEAESDGFFTSMRGHFTLENASRSLGRSSQVAEVKLTALTSFARSGWAVIEAHGRMDEEKEAEQQKDMFASLEENLPVFMQTLWDFCALDIESTLRNICNKILKDISVSWQIRYRRALALQKMGRIFRDVGQVEYNDFSQPKSVKQHLENALFEATKPKDERNP
eukprot:TRINITY_DN41545_c0_g1_i1.p1 TRINITY_DN41545_c0_g1~~TRINITY_DN41545_c0_g1_i1.p1  ORF type:complete len:1020 (-),score=191.72 TRINITY_DN41545_c0_g1_i1:72-3041(-)